MCCVTAETKQYFNMPTRTMGYNLSLHIQTQTKTEAIHYLTIKYTKPSQILIFYCINNKSTDVQLTK
jgi:hypothetical protein